MLARIYGLMWFLLAGTTALLFVGGELNDQALTVVGFFTATLVFIGMSVMLPLSVSRQSANGY